MRRILIVGNAKMNLGCDSLSTLLSALIKACRQYPRLDLAYCPPFTLLTAAKEVLGDHPIGLGAQNMSRESEGAFTGEISSRMLVEAGCTHVIVGHSERRRYYHETNDDVSRKAALAVEADLIPILCVGETLADRESGRTEAVLAEQVSGCLRGLNLSSTGRLVMAYEPIWAIGTGKHASPEQAQAAHAFIREQMGSLLGRKIAQGTRILYGGSVKGDNSRELLALPDVDGALVGGASLTAQAFLPILSGVPN